MRTKILLLLFCLLSLDVMGQVPITREKKYVVTFSCDVPSATLRIDGGASGSANGSHTLKTGRHSITVTASGYEDYRRTITVDKRNTSFQIHLTKKPAPEPTEYVVTFSCDIPSATLRIDGGGSGSANGSRTLKTGRHSIIVTASGYEDYQDIITVDKRNTSFRIHLTKKPEPTEYVVTFSCDVPSATLRIDGGGSGSANGSHTLKTGSHSIAVTASGYEDYRGTITVDKRNTSFQIHLAKKPEPKPVAVSTGTVNGHEWVDLGLSVKWATTNVGASSPGDYGGYYAWGETRTKSRYDWDNCFDCLDSTADNWGTYKLGGQTRITPSSGHDTARENWGGTWRMPTDAENKELCEKCTWTWTTQNGHKGYRVTGPNGNSIFLPAAGYRDGTDTDDVGGIGYYWSGTLSSSDSFDARSLGFYSGYHYTGGSYRRNGRSVRPVTE